VLFGNAISWFRKWIGGGGGDLRKELVSLWGWKHVVKFLCPGEGGTLKTVFFQWEGRGKKGSHTAKKKDLNQHGAWELLLKGDGPFLPECLERREKTSEMLLAEHCRSPVLGFAVAKMGNSNTGREEQRG